MPWQADGGRKRGSLRFPSGRKPSLRLDHAFAGATSADRTRSRLEVRDHRMVRHCPHDQPGVTQAWLVAFSGQHRRSIDQTEHGAVEVCSFRGCPV